MKNIEEEDKIIDGFQSEGELDSQEIYIKAAEKNQSHIHKEQVKFILPPPQQIVEKRYSLQPDMLTGWSPRKDRPSPIPTVFEHLYVDSIVQTLLNKKVSDQSLCYLGPRFQNTFFAWYKMPFKYPYSHIEQPTNMKMTNRQFCGQHKNKLNEVIFDSFFETANLDCAIKVGENEYDLYMRVDSNTKGHFHWFNYKMTNLKQGEKYRFNLCNFQKEKVLYSRGMKPYIFSRKNFEKEGISWEQGGENVKYEKKPGKSGNLNQMKMKIFYKLSFQLQINYENDEIQVAYCIPYSFTDLNNFLSKIKEKTSNLNFYQQEKLCLSLGGLQVPLITIHQETEKSEQKKQTKKSFFKTPQKKHPKPDKKCIVLSGRVHPGQSNGSYVMEGLIAFLCSGSRLAKDLRSQVIFKIVPMLNPDGVCLGNYRTGLSGKDFNREYNNPDRFLFPEISAFKQLVIESKRKYGQNFLMYVDFHGHSVKKNVFMYGPEYTLMDRQYYQSRVFPKILDNRTEMFRYYSCIFKITQQKKTTARAIFQKQHNINLSFTIQASNGSYYNTEELKDVPFNDRSWIRMGRQTGQALKTYIEFVILADIARKEKIQSLKQRKQKSSLRQSMLYMRKRERINEVKTSQLKKEKSSSKYSNDIMKYILDQIRQAEEKQMKIDRWSDDNISEGISDQESDDLDLAQLNIIYKAIKKKKKIHYELSKNHETYQDADEFVNTRIEEQLQEKNKNSKLIHRKSASNQVEATSLKRLHQQKYTNVVNLQFEEKNKFQPQLVKKRPSFSFNKKNFRQFVYSQNKKDQYSTMRKNSPKAVGGTFLNQNIFKQLEKMKNSSKKFKQSHEPIQCITIQPIPKH